MLVLGSHVNTFTGSAVGTVRAAGGGILKVLNTAIDRSEIVTYRLANPHSLVVYRHVFPGGTSQDPVSRCATLLASVAPISDLVDVIETPWNEELEDNAHLAQYAQMTIQAVGILEAAGFATAIGNFSESRPLLPDWPFFAAALVKSKQPKYLSVHEYGAPRMQDGGGYLYYRQLKSPLPVLVTECGIDGGVISQAEAGKGWRNYTDAAGYAAQLAAYASETAKDGVRAAIFCCGQFGDWANFDIAGESAIEATIREDFTVATTFSVGPGIAAMMLKHKDIATSNEHYVEDATGQVFKSEAFGTLGQYVWNKDSNQTGFFPFA